MIKNVQVVVVRKLENVIVSTDYQVVVAVPAWEKKKVCSLKMALTHHPEQKASTSLFSC